MVQNSSVKCSNAARGSVRDGLAALHILENLLRSPRIGPRALEQVVEDLRSSCPPLTQSFGSLASQIIEDRPAAEPMMSRVTALAASRIEQLQAALVRAANEDIKARSRLLLEAEVHRVRADLDALFNLIELAGAAINARTTELDLGAMLNEVLDGLAPSERKRGDVLRVRLNVPDPHATIVTDPRVVIALVRLAIGLLASKGARNIEVRAFHRPDDSTRLLVHPSANTTSARACVAPLIVEPSLAVARRAASEVRAELAFDETDGTVTLEMPALAFSQTVLRSPVSVQP